MLLQKGSTGSEVTKLQTLLISKGYSCSSAGADGQFGQGTYDAVIRFQNDKNLSADGIVGPATWAALNSSSEPLLRRGSTGAEVTRLQRLLISKGYSCGSAGADGDFGQGTYDAVIRFQNAKTLSADGIVGPATWAALNSSSNVSSGQPLLQRGDKGDVVKKLQNLLIGHGYSCGSSGADSDFGGGTFNAVISFQGSNRLSIDGIVGPATWAALYSLTAINFWNSTGAHNTPTPTASIKRFIDIAKEELAIGCRETYDFSTGEGDNRTRFGQWYGINGVAWCAMFVSYCADKAGLIPGSVPKFCYVPNGVNWYRSMGRLHLRSAGYIPKPGDVFFHYNGNDWSHTGIVLSCSNGIVTTIEGNCGDKLTSRKLSLNGNDYSLDAFGKV